MRRRRTLCGDAVRPAARAQERDHVAPPKVRGRQRDAKPHADEQQAKEDLPGNVLIRGSASRPPPVNQMPPQIRKSVLTVYVPVSNLSILTADKRKGDTTGNNYTKPPGPTPRRRARTLRLGVGSKESIIWSEASANGSPTRCVTATLFLYACATSR